ncbi:TPA: hypothetical protein ACVGM8_001244 [Pseudomonas aeruginosa]
MSKVHSITAEHLAGASALDGEELTLALLRENEDLAALHAVIELAPAFAALQWGCSF